MNLLTSKRFLVEVLDGVTLCFQYDTVVEANIKCFELSTKIDEQDAEGIKEILDKEQDNLTTMLGQAPIFLPDIMW